MVSSESQVGVIDRADTDFPTFTSGVVSAPLYDSTTQRFSGMFTLADVVHLIQYYYLTQNEYDNVIAEVEGFQLESLRRKLTPRP